MWDEVNSEVRSPKNNGDISNKEGRRRNVLRNGEQWYDILSDSKVRQG